MDMSMDAYVRQKRNSDSLRHRLRYPIAHGQNLPPAVDLRPWMTTIEDQGEMRSCVSNAIAGSLEYLYRRSTGKAVDVSRLFIDFNARVANLKQNQQQESVINIDGPDNSFTTNRKAGLRALQQYGFCLESIWPYDQRLYMRKPPKYVYEEAARRSVTILKVPINIDSIKTCLAHQIPVLIGISLRSDEAYNNRGYVHIPKIPPDEGWHACLVVGYDDSTRHFTIRNSWGTDWGDKGYCYVPYEYLIDRRLVLTRDAFWAITEIVPRERMIRGYVSYPNFTQYNQQIMVGDQSFRRQHRKRHHHHHHHRQRG